MIVAALLLGSLPTLQVSDAERVDAFVREAMQDPAAVGLSVAVARGAAAPYAAGHGTAELEFGSPADAGTLFRIGSITKQFTAAAIVALAEADELALDDPLTVHLPGYTTHGREITLRHLLTHTSGIPSYTGLGPVWSDHVPLELTDDQLVALWKDLPLEFEPGTAFRYCNSGYYLLGMVIGEVTGRPWAEHLDAAFLEPLGLERTRVGSNADVIPNRAQGYVLEDGALKNDGPIGMSQPGAAGALLSTAGELVRWQQALVAGRVVSPAGYEEMTLPYLLENGNETGYGLGLSLEDVAGERCVSHGGGINGFNSTLLYFPDSELHVAVISNCEQFSAQGVGHGLAGLLLADD